MPISGHSIYPVELAAEVRVRWLASDYPQEYLLGPSQLTYVLDAAYQASLLKEEGEPVRCRIMICSPTDFESGEEFGPREISILRFEETRDFTPHDIRKLAAAAGYYRSLLGVQLDEYGHASIWGIIITGTYWFNRIEGGRFDGFPLPPNLVVHILGAGHLTVASGYTRVLETAGGELLTDGFDPFHSKWLRQKFSRTRETFLSEFQAQTGQTTETQVSESFLSTAAQGVFRRVLNLTRGRRHGGMLVYLPEDVANSQELDDWFRFRVKFNREPTTLRFRRLMDMLMRRVQFLGQQQGLSVVTWADYQKMQDAELAELDEAIIEYAHVLSDLMCVDGSVVLDHGFRMIGFGGEILGESHATYIHRALDLEAYQTIRELALESGTRHRSAYRLVSGLQETIAIVVSQDGAIRFVAEHNQKLTYWPYLP